jgi:hypothetical protein
MLREQDLTWSVGGSIEKSREANESRNLRDDNAANARSVLVEEHTASFDEVDLSQCPCSK